MIIRKGIFSYLCCFFQEWSNRYAKSCANKKINGDIDEDIYPASNGGYFNRNLFSESYFAPQNSNISKFANSSRNSDKSNLSLQSENYLCNGKTCNSAKDKTFTMPQNHFGTAKRSHRQPKPYNYDNSQANEMGGDPSRNETYHNNFRMQENPTFGLAAGRCDTYLDDDGEQFCLGNVPPMTVMNHQYSRPTNLRTSPNDTSGARAFASFKAKNRDTEYHTSTRSEPGNNL